MTLTEFEAQALRCVLPAAITAHSARATTARNKGHHDRADTLTAEATALADLFTRLRTSQAIAS